MRRLLPLLLLVSLAAPAADPPDLAMGQSHAPAAAAARTWVGASGYKMVWVPAGSFDMGSPSSEKERESDEQHHRVTLTKGYWAGELEVTQSLWKAVMGTDPVSERSPTYQSLSLVGGQLPVVSIDWCESVAFANALSQRDGLRPAYGGVESCDATSSSSVTWDRSSDGYRLATEAEWERAARGGAQTKYVGTDELGSVCNFGNVADATANTLWPDWTSVAPCNDGAAAVSAVGAYSPNAYGLKDVVGNAWEWTWDWKADFDKAAAIDPAGPGSGSSRVLRGGSWIGGTQLMRVADRFDLPVDSWGAFWGLRLVRSRGVFELEPALPRMGEEVAAPVVVPGAVQPKPQIVVVGRSTTSLSSLEKQLVELECVAESLKVAEASSIQEEASKAATQQASMRTTWLPLQGREAAVLALPAGEARAPMIAEVEKFLADAKALQVTRTAGSVTVPVALRPSATLRKDVDCGTRSVALAASRTTALPVAEVREAEEMLVRLKAPGPAGAGGQTWVGASGYRMMWVPAGSFDMGSPASETGRYEAEQEHRVTLTMGYWAGELEVTQALWKKVMGKNPVSERSASYEGVSLVGGQLPVVFIDWCESVAFANALSKRDGLRPAYGGVKDCDSTFSSSVTWDRSSDGYRLPTEAEWERAARGGAQTTYVGTNELALVCQYGNVLDATAKERWSLSTVAPCNDGAAGPSAVGAYSANAYGLKDVVGNVWEWTWDGKEDYDATAATDPAVPGSGAHRVIRGGSWGDEPRYIRVSNRDHGVDPRKIDLGLRLVRSHLVP